ncbi:MAG: hypothetical protein E6Q97_10090 [Desulfurellales bacterium]|nr:MAG: hypothetical protein E6Q97_10090 [Desulfurellales bacterium]
MSVIGDYSAVTREIWPQKRIEQRFYQESPVLANCKRTENFAEKFKNITVQYGFAQGASHTASVVLGSSTLGVNGPKYAEFQVPLIEDFHADTIPDTAVERGKFNHASLVDNVEKMVEGIVSTLAGRASFEAHRGATGRRGVRGSVSSDVLTLATASDVYNFEVGQQIVAAQTETGVLRDSGDHVTLIAVDPVAGTLTADANWSNIASMADGDSLFVRGDAANNTGTNLGMWGLGAWNPYGTPAALGGVTRTANRDRLAGISLNASALSTKQRALKALANKMFLARKGKGISRDIKAILHPNDFDSLTTDLQSAVRYINFDSKAQNVYFEGVVIQTALGAIPVLQDPYAVEGYGRIIDFAELEFSTLMKAPRIVENDGLKMLRQSAAFGQEMRGVWKGNLVTENPITMGVCLLP